MVSILFFIYLINKKNIKAWTLTTHLFPLIFIACVFMHNHQQTNYWEYSSIQRKLMINYNANEVLADVYGKEEALLRVSKMQEEATLKGSYKEQARILQTEINLLLIRHTF